MKEKILQQGAEANIILVEQNGKEPFIIKDRIKKGYRLTSIDEQIRTRRTRAETKLLEKASQIIDSPKPLFEHSIKNSSKLKMPFIDGKKLSEYLDSFPLEKQKKICRILGSNIAKLHDNGIIHGDFTTSNMILKNGKVFLIDFGLGFISHKIEDKAVDLHLLRQALEAKHFLHWHDLFKSVVLGYSSSKNSISVLEQLKKVEARGRYKEAY
jgi:TP53 regulating kinase-like protein